MECPHNHGSMTLQQRLKTVTLGCNIWHFDVDVYVCPVCGREIEPAVLENKSGAVAPAAVPSGKRWTDRVINRFLRKLRA